MRLRERVEGPRGFTVFCNEHHVAEIYRSIQSPDIVLNNHYPNNVDKRETDREAKEANVNNRKLREINLLSKYALTSQK